MVMAKVLATAAMQEGKCVTWLPSYGAEVRGGAARCMLIISDKKIGSPHISVADTLVAMNELSLNKYLSCLKPGGLLVLNTSLAQPPQNKTKIKLIKVPATNLAIELGNIRVANTVLLGAYVAKQRSVGKQTMLAVMKDLSQGLSPELFEINKKAFEVGYKNK